MAQVCRTYGMRILSHGEVSLEIDKGSDSERSE